LRIVYARDQIFRVLGLRPANATQEERRSTKLLEQRRMLGIRVEYSGSQVGQSRCDMHGFVRCGALNAALKKAKYTKSRDQQCCQHEIRRGRPAGRGHRSDIIARGRRKIAKCFRKIASRSQKIAMDCRNPWESARFVALFEDATLGGRRTAITPG